MADGYASPLYAQGLIRHRGAAIDLGELSPPWTLSNRAEGASRLFHWDAWVRNTLCVHELLRHLDFDVTPSTSRQGSAVTLRAYTAASPVGVDIAKIVAPSMDVFEQQIEQVLCWADLREERSPEILTQIDNQHCFWGMLIPIHTDRMRFTRELLEVAVQATIFIEMRFKHELGCWRPTDFSPQVQPMVTTPGHASLPSGHCTQSYVIHRVLSALLNADASKPGCASLLHQFDRIAERVSVNRVIAGLHFPVDNVAGRALGTALGAYVVHCCVGADAPPCCAVFDGASYVAEDGFDPLRQILFASKEPQATFYGSSQDQVDNIITVPSPAILGSLWDKARREVLELGLQFA